MTSQLDFRLQAVHLAVWEDLPFLSLCDVVNLHRPHDRHPMIGPYSDIFASNKITRNNPLTINDC